MKYLICAIALFVLLTLQTGFFAAIIGRDAGNLILLFIIISVILGDTKQTVFAVVAGGLMLDFVSGTLDSTILLSLAAAAGFTYLAITKFIPKEATRSILLVCVIGGTITFSVVVVLINQVFRSLGLDTQLEWRYILGIKLLIDIAANLILIYPVQYFYLFMEKLERKLIKHESR